MSKIILKEESYRLIGILFKVHNTLGPICKERNYQDAVEILLKQNNINYEREKELFMPFGGDKLDGFFADFVIDNKIILELKAAKSIKNEDIRQTLRYLEAANLPLGIIANFKRQKLERKRILNPKAINSSDNYNQRNSSSIRAICDGFAKGSTRIVFFGTPELASHTLSKLLQSNFCDILAVVTVPDKPTGRRQELTPPPVKLIAQQNNVEVLQPDKLKNNQPFINQLKKYNADLFIIIAYGKIIPQKILNIPKHGCLNIHYSLLPKYRGPSPVQYALLNGDQETGVTIILLDEKMDHGSIVARCRLSAQGGSALGRQIADSDTSETLFRKLAKAGDELLLQTIPKYIAGKIKPVEQDHNQATYTKIIKKEDGLINWSKSAQEIYNMWRAFQPWPGVHGESRIKSQELRVKLVETQPYRQPISDISTAPSELFVQDKKLLVRCGQNTHLQILSLQPEGKKTINAESFINGYMK